MKFVIASDIHGSATWARALAAEIDRIQPDRVLLLGDVLYHGPRSDLPDGYAPREVAAILNGMAGHITAVRGNCDAEVDQMMLEFPCMADYAQVYDERGRELFLTHGHVWGPGLANSVDRMPVLSEGAVLLFGHTHIKVNGPSAARPDVWLVNPGSVSIPKDGTHSFATYEAGAFELHDLTLPE